MANQPHRFMALRSSSTPPATAQSALVKGQPAVMVKVLVSPKHRSRRVAPALISSATLLGMIGLVVGGSWLAVQMIVNPGAVGWLAWILPDWSRSPFVQANVPKSLSDIRREAESEKLSVGTPIPLQSGRLSKGDILLPLFAEATPCPKANQNPSACQQLVELRLYRPQADGADRDSSLALIDRIAISGPQELEAIAPLVRNASTSPGSTRVLPLESVSVMTGDAVAPGVWIALSGNWRRSSHHVVYGQIVHYNVARSRLEPLLQWTSPAGKLPTWKAITGQNYDELVVDQSIGLEPNLQIYRVQLADSPTQSARLEAIALHETAVKNRSYENGLLLARNGLWTTALQVMQVFKQRQPKLWTAEAQAQLDLIAAHAERTQAQATRTWASPSQQISAQLIDGRWGAGLRSVQSSLQNGYELTNLLVTDRDRLWRRIETALRVNPNQPDVMAWGALLTYAEQGRTGSIAWSRQRTQSLPSATATNQRVVEVLNWIDRPAVSTTTAANPDAVATPAASLTSSHSSELIGTATPVTAIAENEWFRLNPDVPLSLPAGQTWYEIQVAEFYDGQRWRRSPFADLNAAKSAQPIEAQLGLAQNSQMQIVIWTADAQPQVVQAAIEAVRVQNGTLQLLAAGDPASSGNSPDSNSPLPPLAITLNTLTWAEPSSSSSLADLQQDGDRLQALLPKLWRELQQSGQFLSIPVTDAAQMLPEVAALPMQQIDLTGNGQPEVWLTVQPQWLSNSRYTAVGVDASAEIGSNAPPKTLIFSDQGTLIYSELTQTPNQMLLGRLTSGSSAGNMLLVSRDQNYRLLRWSDQRQQFE
jgi:hypothetical protein